jgi:formylglycine-generating enzyme required for sulfatase activity
LINWNGDPDSEEFKKLLRSVTRLVSTATNNVQIPTVQTKSLSPKTSSKPSATCSKALDEPNPVYLEPEMIVIPAGCFQMGSKFKDNEKLAHTVTFAKPFWIAKNLVTFGQYDLFAQANKRKLPYDNLWGRAQRPVINVSWQDATDYASWLAKLSGNSYRLSSEAEWEYAARANTTSEYFWEGQGNAIDFAWYIDNSEGKTHPVGEKNPNAFGLYDMSGNVWEWVQDGWHDNYDKAPDDGSAWQHQYNRRVLRGGSWGNDRVNLRSADRNWSYPGNRNYDIGFRLAQD